MTMAVPSPGHGSWLTEQRVTRLGQMTLALRVKGGWGTSEVPRRGWDACGGPLAEVEELYSVLKSCSLVTTIGDRVVLTRAGDRVALAVRRGDPTGLALVLIRGGHLHEQARHLLEVATIHQDRTLTLGHTHARAVAPQLVGLLAPLPSVETSPLLRLPSTLVSELGSAFALLPPTEVPPWVQERKRVGDRAEYYSWLIERTADPEKVYWVARDGHDDLGYDIEDRRCCPVRRIEVKGRRGSDVTFYLSDNEWRQAKLHRQDYEVQFWGDIDLSRPEHVEYAALRAAGWPVVIRDPVKVFETDQWEATVVNWKIRFVGGEAEGNQADWRDHP
jgi:uncharacterized protein DUF3883